MNTERHALAAALAAVETPTDLVGLLARHRPGTAPIEAHLPGRGRLESPLWAPGRVVHWLNPGGATPYWTVQAPTARELPTEAELERECRALARRTVGGAAVVLAVADGVWSLWVGVASGGPPQSWRGGLAALDERSLKIWEALVAQEDATLGALRAHRLLARRALGASFFRDVRAALVRVDAGWTGLDDDRSETRAALSIGLLCRLMFLYFIQRKGWLGGDSGYVASLVLDPAVDGVWRERLSPFFYEVLSKPPPQRPRRHRCPDVPYLNGGLFERSAVEQANPRLDLDDVPLRALVGDVLESYRFVESERDDEAAGIDPEMLGAVFEGLMDSEERGSSGTFYTPSALVLECVDAALEAALEPEVGPEIWARLRAGGRGLDPEDAGTAYRCLSEVRVFDPAMGSGAFLLGALERIVALRMAAGGKDRAKETRRTVVTSLHGVDISSTAVMICELRLWLAIAASSPDAPTAVTPLPNLGHAVRHGNALLGAGSFATLEGAEAPGHEIRLQRLRVQAYAEAHGDDKTRLERNLRDGERRISEAMLLSSRERVDERLQDLEPEGRGADLFGRVRPLSVAERREREALRARRRDLDRDLDRVRRGVWSPSFDIQVHFAGALALGGFDVIVGNPPWVRLSKLSAAERERLRGRYRWMADAGGGRPFGAQPDLSVAFVERSVQLLRSGGALAMVLPAKLFTAGYGSALRAGLLRDAPPVCLRDLSAGSVSHFSADVYPAVVVARREDGYGSHHFVRIEDGAGRRSAAAVDRLGADAHPGSPWLLMGAGAVEVYRRLREEHPSLGARFTPRLGVKTGYNAAFIDAPDGLGPSVWAVRGGDVSAFHVKPSSRMLFAHDVRTGLPLGPDGLDAATHRWFSEHTQRLAARADANESDPPWRVFRVPPENLGHRVVWRDIGERLEAAVLPPVAVGGPVALNSTYSVAVEDLRQSLRLAAWLCSTPARFVAAATAERALGGYRRFMARNVAQVPLPEVVAVGSGGDGEEVDRLALALSRAPTDEELWRELDRFAARVLQLTPADVAAIRGEDERLSLSLSVVPPRRRRSLAADAGGTRGTQ